MPPKKRQRLSPPEESSTAATPRDAVAPKQASGAPSPEELVNDPWTDEQNAALMKGLIKWKPVGMHKHFRMISLANYLHSHGHEADHTRIPGIWAKLNTLYNMKTLDEREDGYGDSLLRGSSEDRSTPSSAATGESGEGDGSDDDDGSSGSGHGGRGKRSNPPYFPFQLPDEPDFHARVYDKRLAPDDEDDSASSPPELDHQMGTSIDEPAIARSFAMLDTEDYGDREMSTDQESRASTPPAVTRGGGRGRGRGRGSRGDAGRGRGGRAKEDTAPTRGRGTRGRPRKEVEVEAEESADDDDDEEEEEEEEEEASEEESEEDEEEQENEKETPRTRGGATRGKARGRGGGRGRGRGRGR